MKRINSWSKLKMRQLSGWVKAATREIERGSSIARNNFLFSVFVSASDGINSFARQNGVSTDLKIVQIEFRFAKFGFIARRESHTENGTRKFLREFVVRLHGERIWIGKRGRGVRRRHHNDGSGEFTSVCRRKRFFCADFHSLRLTFFAFFFCVRETKLVLLLRFHIEFQNSTKSFRFFRDASGLRFHRIHEADAINIAVFPHGSMAWMRVQMLWLNRAKCLFAELVLIVCHSREWNWIAFNDIVMEHWMLLHSISSVFLRVLDGIWMSRCCCCKWN